MSNLNFRKALTYGIDRSKYFNSELNSLVSTIVPSGFSYNNQKDYYDYFIETYASKNNITFDEALLLFEKDPYYNLNKSDYYLNLAIQALELTSDDLPIKIEYTYYYNDDHSIYELNRIDQWNKALNGCDLSSNNCTHDKVEIVFNTEVDSINDFNIAFANKEYNITFVGLYPDFNDPTTFLNSFGSNGELIGFLNHSDGDEISNKLDLINNYYEESNLNERYKLCSELEYYIILEKNLLLPLSLRGSNEQIVVSNLVPYLKMKASYGLSPFKFKHRKIKNKNYTQEEIKELKEEYEKGRTIK